MNAASDDSIQLLYAHEPSLDKRQKSRILTRHSSISKTADNIDNAECACELPVGITSLLFDNC